MILIRIHKGGWVFNGNVAEFSIDKYMLQLAMLFEHKQRGVERVTALLAKTADNAKHFKYVLERFIQSLPFIFVDICRITFIS